jgi:hypothetical protein
MKEHAYGWMNLDKQYKTSLSEINQQDVEEYILQVAQ